MIDYPPLTLQEVEKKFQDYVERGDLRAFWESLRILKEQRSIRPASDTANPISIAMLPLAGIALVFAVVLPKQDAAFRIVALTILSIAVALRIYWNLEAKRFKERSAYCEKLDLLALDYLEKITAAPKFVPQPLHKEHHDILAELFNRTNKRPPGMAKVFSLK